MAVMYGYDSGPIGPNDIAAMEARETALSQMIGSIARTEHETDYYRLRGSQAMRRTFIAPLYDSEQQIPKMEEARATLVEVARFLLDARKNGTIGPEIEPTITVFIERLKQTKEWLATLRGESK